jgi:hypothetical protein
MSTRELLFQLASTINKIQQCVLALYKAESIIIRVITKLPNSEQSYKGKVKTHKYINRKNQSTTGKLHHLIKCNLISQRYS